MDVKDGLGLVGRVLDRQYRVERVVGEGGFGVVYQGWHLSFQHPIAIKCLKIPNVFTQEAKASVIEQFQSEGATLFKLSEHPSITRVYSFGIAVGSGGLEIPFLIMEWLDGCTLEQQIRNQGRPFTEQEALTILKAVLEAMSFAHQQKIAHRDLKPANLFMAKTLLGERVKVLDFGIAKIMREGERITQVTSKQASGTTAFSPIYGAPEQFNANHHGKSGPWTDVYALGLLITEMVTGERPSHCSNYVEFYQAAISSERPTPRRKGVWISEGLEQLCERALAVDPRDRYRNAGEMLDACQQLNLPPSRISVPVQSASGPTKFAEPLPNALQSPQPPRHFRHKVPAATKRASLTELESANKKPGAKAVWENRPYPQTPPQGSENEKQKSTGCWIWFALLVFIPLLFMVGIFLLYVAAIVIKVLRL
jgi:eukaryotic-like serine/threonine-protein kinase